MNKFRNKKTEVDGVIFDSKKEAARYCDLKIIERAGEIKNLRLQPRYELQPAFVSKKITNGLESSKKIRKIEYVADFEYYSEKYKGIVVEDVKGFETSIFKLKEKLFLFKYPDLMFLKT